MNPNSAPAELDGWPRLDAPGYLETSTTMQLWAQVVGKTRLALCPMTNHWWQVPFYVSARGLSSSPMPIGSRVLDVEFDFVAHQLILRTSDGGSESLKLRAGPLSAFYEAYRGRLRQLGIDVELNPLSTEMPEVVRLDRDSSTRPYNRDWANAFFRALVQADALLKEFRGRFLGKASPVHFFWGGFDLAVTRFSGRPAPPHPGGIPHIRDEVMREAYSHEVSSAGFWPGNALFPEVAFYSYAYPEPAGFKEAAVHPEAARYQPSLGDFVLPYAAARAAADPRADVLAFLESTYVAAADHAHWDRSALERQVATDDRRGGR